MKIYCINLARSADRRAFQLAQAQRLGLDMEFIDAVDFKSLPENTLIEAAQHWTRPIVGKDVGCFYSHRKAWELVAKNHEPAMIIEDDIVFSNGLPEVLQALAAQPFPQNRVYDLEYAPRKHVISKMHLWTQGSVRASRMFVNKNGAGCYVMHPKVAQRAVTHTSRFVMTDSWLWSRPWIEQVQVEPCVAAQSQDINKPASKVSLPTQGEQAKEYVQTSWLRKKWIRLKLTADQGAAFVKALLFGQNRYLVIQPEHFVYHE